MLPIRFFASRSFSAGITAAFLLSPRRSTARCTSWPSSCRSGSGTSVLGAGLRLLPWTATLLVVGPAAPGSWQIESGHGPVLAGRVGAPGRGAGLARRSSARRRAAVQHDRRAPRRRPGVGIARRRCPVSQASHRRGRRPRRRRQGRGHHQHAAGARRRVRGRRRRGRCTSAGSYTSAGDGSATGSGRPWPPAAGAGRALGLAASSGAPATERRRMTEQSGRMRPKTDEFG